MMFAHESYILEHSNNHKLQKVYTSKLNLKNIYYVVYTCTYKLLIHYILHDQGVHHIIILYTYDDD